MSGLNGEFGMGWSPDQPFGSIPGSMPSAETSFEVTSSEAPTTPETSVSPVPGPSPYTTPEGSVSPVGPSPAEAYSPAPTSSEVPWTPEGSAPPPGEAPRGAMPTPEEAGGVVGTVPGPGWTEESGMPGPMIDTGPVYAPKKSNTGLIVGGVAAGAVGLGALVYAIVKSRK